MMRKNVNFTSCFTAATLAVGLCLFAGTVVSADEKAPEKKSTEKPDASQKMTKEQKIQKMREYYAKMKKKQMEPRFLIGVSAKPVPKAMRLHLPAVKEQGLLVYYVGKNTPAAKAGIKQYDILFTANQTALKSLLDLHKIVTTSGKEKKAISLELLREGTKQTLELTPVLSSTLMKTVKPTKIKEENVSIPQLNKLIPGVFNQGKMVIETGEKDGIRIQVTKIRGAGEKQTPIEIVVTKNGEMIWKGTEKEVEKAPKEYQETIRGSLRSAKTITFSDLKMNPEMDVNKLFKKHGMLHQRFHAHPSHNAPRLLEKQISELDKQMKALNEAVEKLNEKFEDK